MKNKTIYIFKEFFIFTVIFFFKVSGKEDVRKPNGSSTIHKLQGSMRGNTHTETYGNVHAEHTALHSSPMSNVHDNPHHNNMFNKSPNYNTNIENAEDLTYGKMVFR